MEKTEVGQRVAAEIENETVDSPMRSKQKPTAMTETGVANERL